jgi:hypothetical protein
MPMEKVSRSEAISKKEFNRRLKKWFTGTEETQIGSKTAYKKTPWVYVKDEADLYYLNADTKREGVAKYLSLCKKYGHDMKWFIVLNRNGKLNSIAYGTKDNRIKRFYLYLKL